MNPHVQRDWEHTQWDLEDRRRKEVTRSTKLVDRFERFTYHTMTQVHIPLLKIQGIFVLADGTVLLSGQGIVEYGETSAGAFVMSLAPSGIVTRIAGSRWNGSYAGRGDRAQFHDLKQITVNSQGNMLAIDRETVRCISQSGFACFFAGRARMGGWPPLQSGYVNGNFEDARFSENMNGIAYIPGTPGTPEAVVVADTSNHVIRMIQNGTVTTLAGWTDEEPRQVFGDNRGYRDTEEGITARFYCPKGIAVDRDGSILVADSCNHVVRRVTLDGTVTTVVGIPGKAGRADGSVDPQFDCPSEVVVDGDGIIVVADNGNLLRQIRLDHDASGVLPDTFVVSTLKSMPSNIRALALDERGRLLVALDDREETLFVVDVGLAPPCYMGPTLSATVLASTVQNAQWHRQRKMLQNTSRWNKASYDIVVVVQKRGYLLHRDILKTKTRYFEDVLEKRTRWKRPRQEHAEQYFLDGVPCIDLKYNDDDFVNGIQVDNDIFSAAGAAAVAVELDAVELDTPQQNSFKMIINYIYYGDNEVLTKSTDKDVTTNWVQYLQVETLTSLFYVQV